MIKNYIFRCFEEKRCFFTINNADAFTKSIPITSSSTSSSRHAKHEALLPEVELRRHAKRTEHAHHNTRNESQRQKSKLVQPAEFKVLSAGPCTVP